MKNPHWTPEQEEQIALAERISTRATIFELGCAEFLKGHMPLDHHIEEIRDILGSCVALRQDSRAIHERLRPSPRAGESKSSTKQKAKNK